jgi:hypothetical protein
VLKKIVEGLLQALSMAMGLAFLGWLGYEISLGLSPPSDPPKPPCEQRPQTGSEILAGIDDPGKVRCFMWEGLDGYEVEGGGHDGDDVGGWVKGYLSGKSALLTNDEIDDAMGKFCKSNPCLTVRQAVDSLLNNEKTNADRK